MAEFAPVASLPIYKRLEEAGELGNYQLLIATEVNKDQDAWGNFWGRQAIQHADYRAPEQFIIMDNGLIETGHPTSAPELFAAAETVGANCIVLPDALGDMKMTLKLVRASIKAFEQGDYPLMGVVQGATVTDIGKLLREYMSMGIKYLSVPRVMVELHGSRIGLVDWVDDYWRGGRPDTPKQFIHLLGFSDRLEDDFEAAQHPSVMGIDSAMPIWYALAYNEYLPGGGPPRSRHAFYAGKRPENYWTLEPDPHSANFDIVLGNIQKVRSWLTVAPVALTAPQL